MHNNIAQFKPRPTFERLCSKGLEALGKLASRHHMQFELVYMMGVGTRPDACKTAHTLTAPELEACLDVLMVMDHWRHTYDLRPPYEHLEYLSSLERHGGRAMFRAGRLTRRGEDIVERYDAEREGRAIRPIA